MTFAANLYAWENIPGGWNFVSNSALLYALVEYETMTQHKSKRTLESSEERRNRRVDELLQNPAIKAAVHRDQHLQPDDDQEHVSRQAAYTGR